MAVTQLTLQKGEYKNLKFTIKDEDGAILYDANASFRFLLKESKSDTSYAVEIEDDDFDKTYWDSDNGIVYAPVPTSGLTSGINYYGILEITFSATDIDYSDDIRIKIKPSVAHD